jgi:hypothetical protein
MFKKSVLGVVFVSVFVLVCGWAPVFAAESTFSISPPPIATPVFGVKETDVKVGATYLNMKSTDPGIDFDLSGYGVNFVGRSAFGSVLAIDYAVGIIYLTGDIKSGSTGTATGTGLSMDLSGASIPISFNLEVQPYKNDVFNIILFAGPAFNISAIDVETQVPFFTGTSVTTVSDTITTTSILYGPQGGVQMGFAVGDFHIDVFGMMMSQQGTQTMDSTFGGSTSTDVPAYTTTSYGADFMYVPWGLTLSSILQEAKQSDQNGFKTTMYQLSWSHKF